MNIKGLKPGTRQAFAIIVLLVIAVGLPSLFFPFGRDQGIHAYVGWSWLHGRLPYRDVWVQKGPLHFVPYLLTTGLFGQTMWGIRVFDLGWQLFSSWLLYRVGRHTLRQRGAIIAAGLYLLTYYSLGYQNIPHTEGFFWPMILLGMLCYQRAPNSRRPFWPLFWSGFCAGLALWVKQTAVLQIAGLFLWIIFDHWRARESRFWAIASRWLALGLGLLTVIASSCLLLAAFGMLEPMLEIMRYSTIDYPSTNNPLRGAVLDQLLFFGLYTLYLSFRFGLLAFPFLSGVGHLIRQKTRQHWSGIVLMTLLGLLGVYAQGRLWNYQWINVLPFMALIGAHAMDTTWTAIEKKGIPRARREMGWIIVGLALTIPTLGIYTRDYWNVAAYLSGHRSRLEALRPYTTPDFDITQVMEVAKYVRQNTSEQDYLFMQGHFSALYYLADRPNPTRFGTFAPLLFEHPQRDTWQRECLGDLHTHPPRYVVVATGEAAPIASQPETKVTVSFPAFANFLQSYYRLDRQIGDFEIYVRR